MSARTTSIRENTNNKCTNTNRRITDFVNAVTKEKGDNLKATVAYESSHLFSRILGVTNSSVGTV